MHRAGGTQHGSHCEQVKGWNLHCRQCDFGTYSRGWKFRTCFAFAKESGQSAQRLLVTADNTWNLVIDNTMDLYANEDRRSTCPACGSEIRRIPRTEADRSVRFATAMRRYACTGASCGWQDLLPRQPSLHRPETGAAAVAARPVGSRLKAGWRAGRRVAPAVIAGLAGAALAVVVLVGWAPSWLLQARVQSSLLAPGEHHDGVAMTPRHPLLLIEDDDAPPEVQRLSLRQGCVWGKPGRNPYRGTVDQALVSAKLPPEVIQRVMHKIESGQRDDRVAISNAGIRAERDQREFESRNVAMTYGKVLCVNTRVNFPAGHVERASLYEAADKKGNLYSVMVPDVCGNVSVLGARMERGRKRMPLAVLAETDHGAPGLLLMAGSGDDPAQAVPEPSALACALAALAAACGVSLWSRRRAAAKARDSRA
jgi:hypothetical protein